MAIAGIPHPQMSIKFALGQPMCAMTLRWNEAIRFHACFSSKISRKFQASFSHHLYLSSEDWRAATETTGLVESCHKISSWWAILCPPVSIQRIPFVPKKIYIRINFKKTDITIVHELQDGYRTSKSLRVKWIGSDQRRLWQTPRQQYTRNRNLNWHRAITTGRKEKGYQRQEL